MFAHLPDQASKIYNVWNYVMENELRHFPEISRQETVSIVHNQDFKYLSEFKWSSKIWEDVINAKEKEGEY